MGSAVTRWTNRCWAPWSRIFPKSCRALCAKRARVTPNSISACSRGKRYAQQESIPVGPGRGSAAGSLVAFAIRITDIDPIPYNASVIGAQLWYYAPRLPDTVASHFDVAGEPDGWMAKDDFLLMIAGVVVGIAALFAFLIWLVPRVPDSAVNLPNRGYWLAAPRRAATHASIARYLLAFALLTLGFVGGAFFGGSIFNQFDAQH